MRVAWEVEAPYRSREEHQLGNKKEKKKREAAASRVIKVSRELKLPLYTGIRSISLFLFFKKKVFFSSASIAPSRNYRRHFVWSADIYLLLFKIKSFFFSLFFGCVEGARVSLLSADDGKATEKKELCLTP